MAAVASGWAVIGLDNSYARIEELNCVHGPVEGIYNETLTGALQSGSYRASSNFDVISSADVLTICISTHP